MIAIAGVPIGIGQPTRWIAELSNNHGGSLDRAFRLLDAIKAAGADFAKVQCYTPDELVALRGDGPAPQPWGSQGWTMRALYERAQTPHAWFPHLFAHAASIGLPLFSSVFGRDSLALLEDVGCPAYKIARLDNQHAWLYDACKATGKPVIVSSESPTDADLTLWCPPGYPQPLDALQRGLTADRWQTFDGFSYHGIGRGPLLQATRTGCPLIECHVMLADEPSELEAHVSVTIGKLRGIITAARLGAE